MKTDQEFVRQVFVAVAIVALMLCLLLVVWQMAYVLLIIFAGILFAIFLDALAAPLHNRLHLPRRLAVPLVTLGFLGLLALAAYAIGPAVADQVMQLTDRLPQAIARIQNALNDYSWGRSLIEWVRQQWQDAPMSPAKVITGLTGIFSTLFGTLSDLLIILVMGFYLAFHPEPYLNGFLSLFPEQKRARFIEAKAASGNALRWWLVGRGTSMLVIGVLTAAGLWLINMPLVLALAVLAGLLSFVPFLGPVAAALPAVLVGLVESPGQALNVVLVYAAVQLLETNFITPLVQVRAVSLPPAVMLSGQIVMGVLFGIFGILMATPLMVALIVQVQVFYLRGVLHEDVTPLGR